MEPSTDSIFRSITTLFKPGDTIELRVISERGIVNGFYRDQDKLADDAAAIGSSACNVYVCLNPVKDALFARRANKLDRAGRGAAAGDADIAFRRWLLVDIDACRDASGISATDAEKRAGEQLAGQVYNYLAQQLGADSLLVADSGNGYHLVIRLDDVPADDTSRRVCEQLLQRLAEQFDNAQAKVDRTTFNASRICALWGSVKRKGDSIPDRPHRMTKLLRVPEQLRPAAWDKLAELAGPQQSAACLPAAPQPQGSLRVEQLLEQHGLEYSRDDQYRTASGEQATRYILEVCPFDSAHDDRSAAIVCWPSNGAISFSCRHNGCQGKGWEQLQQLWQLPASITATDILLPTAPATAALKLRQVSDVPAVRDTWLWEQRIPLGRLTVVAGNGGVGKTTAICDLSARITLGSGPPGAEQLQRGQVVWISDEEDGSDIGARILSAGGDPKQVFVLAEDEIFDTFTADVPRLAKAIQELGDVRAVVFDTLPDFLGQFNDHHNSGVRQGMRGLIRLARDTGVSVIGLCHFNKMQAGATGHRLLGSVAYRNLPRSVLYVLGDPDDQERRILFHEKSNNGPLAAPLAFCMEAQQGGPVAVRWEQGPVIIPDIERYLQADSKATNGKRDQAADWLCSIWGLGAGPKATAQAISEGEQAGHSKRTLYRAAQDVGVLTTDGNWQLPGNAVPSANP